MTKGIRKKKNPKGYITEFKLKKRAKIKSCQLCGSQIRKFHKKVSKSQKIPARPYGGEICHACLKSSIQLRIFENYS
ncbi:hypothetical protein [Candidatus Hodarchaeum mangrovi]